MVNALPTPPLRQRSPSTCLLSLLWRSRRLWSGCSKADTGYIPHCTSLAGAVHYTPCGGVSPSLHFHPRGQSMQPLAPALNDKEVRKTLGKGSTRSAGSSGNSHECRCFSRSSRIQPNESGNLITSQHCSYELCRASCWAGNTTQPGSQGARGAAARGAKANPRRRDWLANQAAPTSCTSPL